MEVLDVASAMTRLLVRGAAAAYRPEVAALLQYAMKDIAEAASASEPGHCGAARRRFYRRLLLIGGNRDMQCIFPATGIHNNHATNPQHRHTCNPLHTYQGIPRAGDRGS